MAVLSLPEYGRISAISSDDAAEETEEGVALRKRDFESLKKWSREWIPPGIHGNAPGLPADSEKKTPFKLAHWRRREVLQAQNFVGVVRLPSGDCLEILPKITKKLYEGKERSRKILLRMLRMIYEADSKEFKDAALSTGRMPLLEIFIRRFLDEVGSLIRRGIRSDYTPVEDNIPCLRGRLLLPQHIRHNAIHRERFYVRYDAYLPDRPENRLIKTALQRVHIVSRDSENMRRCKIYQDTFEEIPASVNVRADFALLSNDRNVSHYQASLFWSRLILQGESPVPTPGELRCSAILWPMEELFEQYVARIIRRILSPQGWTVTEQAAAEHLVDEHGGSKSYLLKPDFLLEKGENRVIADTKWKNIDGQDKKSVNQADLYQLFAYSEKYLRKSGCNLQRSFLVYPKTDAFQSALPAFHFYTNTAVLKAVPFDLENDTCELFTELTA